MIDKLLLKTRLQSRLEEYAKDLATKSWKGVIGFFTIIDNKEVYFDYYKSIPELQSVKTDELYEIPEDAIEIVMSDRNFVKQLNEFYSYLSKDTNLELIGCKVLSPHELLNELTKTSCWAEETQQDAF